MLNRLQEKKELKGAYDEVLSGFQVLKRNQPFTFKHGGIIPCLELAYETWGELNSQRSNAILLHTGLSGSSHACSHPVTITPPTPMTVTSMYISVPQDNKSAGWWERFIGPGCALDTDKFFVICSNIIGGCYGSTGPSSLNPVTGKEYGMTFPVVSVEDMVHTQALLLDHFGVERVHATVGASLGGMQGLMAAALFPHRVGR